MDDAEKLVQKLFRNLPELEFLKSLIIFFTCAIRSEKIKGASKKLRCTYMYQE